MSAAIIFALGSGALSAVFYASALTGARGGMIFMFLVQLPLFLVGLSREQGWRGAALAGGAGTLAIALTAGAWGAGNYAIAEAVPAIVLMRQASLSRSQADGRIEWYPAGRLLVWLSLYAAAVLLAFMLYYMNTEGGLEGELQRGMVAFFQSIEVSLPPEAERLLDALVGIMPGLGGASWLLITAGNAVLAQALLQRFGHNLRPGVELTSLALPWWLALAVAVTAAVGLLASDGISFAARNLCFVLTVPYFFGGLACLHLLARRRGAGPRMMGLLYMALAIAIVFLTWLAVMAIAGLGLIDQVAGLRRRLARPHDRSDGSWE
ncbi:MAG TPA: DUF2232 domain-containing protein [Alphaproteobacteria bacterium]|nr:DUF2232 domain-containing protein [Alphaproteobacteria bacterium]